MNKEIAFIVLVSLLLLPGIAEAACSIGANPLSMDARAVPGQTVIATWNLYNIHGDRITHVKISAVDPLPGWEISFEPGLHSATYNVTGVLQTVEENVGLEPGSVIEAIPETIPEGVDYVRHPGGEGYIPVRPVKIYVKVHDNAELWKNYNFTFEALGNCLMEPGAVAPAIATQLELDIKTISGEEFYEKVIKEVKKSMEYEIVVTKGSIIEGIGKNAKLKAALEEALGAVLTEDVIEDLAELGKEISENADVGRELMIKEGKSILLLRVKYSGDKKAINFIIYDTVPKAFAEDADEILVNAPGARVKIVEEEPSFLITYPELLPGQEIEISYSVDREVGSDVLGETLAPAMYAGSLEEIEVHGGGEGLDITGFIIYNASWIGIIIILVMLLVYFGFIREREEEYKYSYTGRGF